MIDEWQEAPQLWDAARFEVDHRSDMGQFIFTGSAVPADSSLLSHTGIGRFSWLRMRPMSLYESGESTGEISLSTIVKGGEKQFGTSRLTLDDIAFLLCRGGWPQAVGMKKKPALAQAHAYLDAVVKSDISRADNVQRDELRARRLMKPLSYLISVPFERFSWLRMYKLGIQTFVRRQLFALRILVILLILR